MSDRWGIWAGIALGLLGVYLGGVLGRIPSEVMLYVLLRQIRMADTVTLKARLRSEYCLSHLLVPTLLSRGESRAELQGHIMEQLLSDSVEERWAAWRTMNLCVPKTAERLAGIDPSNSPEAYRNRLQALRDDG